MVIILIGIFIVLPFTIAKIKRIPQFCKFLMKKDRICVIHVGPCSFVQMFKCSFSIKNLSLGPGSSDSFFYVAIVWWFK